MVELFEGRLTAQAGYLLGPLFPHTSEVRAMRSSILWLRPALLALSALVALTVAGQSNSGGNVKAPHAQQQTPPATQTPSDGVTRIAPADARAALEKGTAIIVDVRGEDSYRTGHVKGALWMPDVGAHIKELPRDKMIITYCS